MTWNCLSAEVKSFSISSSVSTGVQRVCQRRTSDESKSVERRKYFSKSCISFLIPHENERSSSRGSKGPWTVRNWQRLREKAKDRPKKRPKKRAKFLFNSISVSIQEEESCSFSWVMKRSVFRGWIARKKREGLKKRWWRETSGQEVAVEEEEKRRHTREDDVAGVEEETVLKKKRRRRRRWSKKPKKTERKESNNRTILSTLFCFFPDLFSSFFFFPFDRRILRLSLCPMSLMSSVCVSHSHALDIKRWEEMKERDVKAKKKRHPKGEKKQLKECYT